MAERVLTILEVSQKQAYIFSSNKLRDNITNSAVIAWVMSSDYFQEKIADPKVFDRKENFVYSGGGHVVLEFASREKAVCFTRKITYTIHSEYPGIEVFAVTLEYDGALTPGENLKELTKKLERKKSMRVSAFHQGTFGVERLDTGTRKAVLLGRRENGMPKAEEQTDRELAPKGYERVYKFSELGGTKHDSNFIAVVHIDGNAMGARVAKVYEAYQDADWNTFKDNISRFSQAIDDDFKSAYKEMAETVARNLESGNLKDLDIRDRNFPVRRIITAGDDICYVTEGRIGVESAAVFIRALSRKENAVDKERYAACAGVAIVHQKYPFYKAYELAESLCSNAKRFGANLSEDKTGGAISSIDWHIDFGELKDSLEEIRQDYAYGENENLALRPYIVEAPEEILAKERFRQYIHFRKLIRKILSNDIAFARGKMKNLRQVLKQGEAAVQHYLKFNKIEDIAMDCYQGVYVNDEIAGVGTGRGLERKMSVTTADGVQRSLLFDAIEMMDTFVSLEE